MSHFSESRHLNRGPLIAVIKIQLDEENNDRIFLHLKDNDEQLAQQFIQKHNLSRILKTHIYERIVMSREAVVARGDERLHGEMMMGDYHEQVMGLRKDVKDDDSDVYKTPIGQRGERKWEDDQRKVFVREEQIENGQGSMIQKRRQNAVQQKKSEHVKANPVKNLSDNTQTTQAPPNHQSKCQIDPQLIYASNSFNRYKNLYDVSGLKLKNSKFSTIHQNDTFSNHNIKQLINNIENQSEVQLSQEKFKKQNKNINLNMNTTNSYRQIFMIKKQQQKEQKALKQGTVKHFIQTSQKDYSNNPQLKINHPQHQLTFAHSSSILHNPHLQRPFNPRISLTKNTDQSQQLRLQNYQQQTKFSSIDREEEYEYTEDNSISFNTPYYEAQHGENHMRVRLMNQQARGSNISKPLAELTLYTNIQSSQNNFFNEKQSSNHFFNAKPPIKQLNLDSELFDESQSFKNLTIKRGQQNVNIRSQYVDANNDANSQFEEQSWRPSRVKFYGKAEMKSLRQSTMSKSLTKSQLSRINKAVTNRLHNEEDIKKKYLNQLKARARNLHEEQIQEKEQLTYKPEINVMSKILAQNRNKENRALQDYLIGHGKLVEQKKQSKIDYQVKKQLQQCSFKPKISEKSQKIVSMQRSMSKSKMQSRHSNLKKSPSTKKTYPQRPSFHPQMNKASQDIVKSKGNFIQRQKGFLEEKKGKMLKKQQQRMIMQKVDLASGHKLFHPQLTEKSIKLAQHYNQQIRLNSNKSVHSYLYELSKIPKVEQKLNPQPSINPQSQKLIQQLHEKRINWLFLQLDSDEDGIISNRKISIDNIPTQILQIIAPVLYEMEDLQTQLNLQDFRNAIKNLTKGLDPCQKSILYGYGTSVRA